MIGESDSGIRNDDSEEDMDERYDVDDGEDSDGDGEHDDVILQLNPALWINEGSGRRSHTRRNRVNESRQEALRKQVRRMSSGLLMRSL